MARDEPVADRHEQGGRHSEEERVERRQAEADGSAGDTHSRYPAPLTVSITGGSPSFRRSVITDMRTVLVNGSTFSSHTRLSSSSGLTTAPSALISTSSTPNSFGVSSTARPA